MFLKQSCFPDCWMNVSSVVSIFKNVGERATAENYSPVSLFSVVSKIFYTLINRRLADHLENCGLFSGFQYGFRSSCTADLLTVVSGRIKRALNSPRATWAIELLEQLIIEQLICLSLSAFFWFWHSILLHKLKSYEIIGLVFGLILSFLSKRLLRVVLDGKSFQEYPVDAGFPQGSILDSTIFPLYCWWHYSSLAVWAGIWFLGTARRWYLNLNLNYVTLDWGVACWFQC